MIEIKRWWGRDEKGKEWKKKEEGRIVKMYVVVFLYALRVTKSFGSKKLELAHIGWARFTCNFFSIIYHVPRHTSISV